MTREEIAPQTRCRVGIAVRDVTAPVGIYARYWGAAKHDTADGIHRPARATAMVFAPLEGNGPRLALVALDYGSFHPAADEQELRGAVRERTGFGEAEFLLSLSHVHAGANASSARTDRPGGHLNDAYRARLADEITAAVEEAKRQLSPGWITWGAGCCGLARNRDYWDGESGRFGCGYNPDGEPDDTVVVGRVTGDDGAIRGVVFNYACHPTTLAWDNHLLSPDYVGAAREVVEQAFGAPALFLQGASGDLGPRQGYVGDPAVADRNGRQLGYAVASAVEGLDPAGTAFAYTGIVTSGADIATWAHRPLRETEVAATRVLRADQRTVNLALKDLPSAQEIRERMASTGDRALSERLQRLLVLREDLGDGESYAMPLWIWRLGQAVAVAIPNEPYSLLQRSLRASFPDNAVLVMGVTNGTMGYLCPRDLYGSGRYQERQSPFRPGCLEQTIEAAQGGIRDALQIATQAGA